MKTVQGRYSGMSVMVLLIAFTVFQNLQRAHSQTNECPVPINGTRRGEPGNIQDNMFHSLAIDPTNENTVYAGTETNGMFKTTDGGAHWTRLRNGLKCTVNQNAYSQIFDIAVSPVNPLLLYASAVNGPGPPSPVTYPSANAGVYRSTNGGLSWTQHTSGFTNTYACYVLIDSTNPNRLYAGIGGVRSTFPPLSGQFYPGGIFLSTDAGLSWSALSLPAGVNTNVPINMLIRGRNQQTLYASWQLHRDDAPIPYGLIKSTDGGQTWDCINPPGRLVYSFDVARQDPNLMYANDTTSQRRVHRSTDGGTTWTPVPTASFFGELRIHPTNSQIIFTTGFTSIVRSTNGLASSVTVYTDSQLTNGQQMLDIKISDSNPNVVWASAKGYYLYRSTNGGDSFTKITAIRDSVYSVSTDVHNNEVTGNSGALSLEQNSPNPFNPSTTIRFRVPASSAGMQGSGRVSLKVFDVLGREVATLVSEQLLPGTYERTFDASNLSSGVYLYRLDTPTFTRTRVMALLH